MPVRTGIALLVLAALAAGSCTPLPVGAPVPVADLHSIARACPEAAVPPEYRFAPANGLPRDVQAVVDTALDEWRRWGRQIVDHRAIDWARTRAVRDLVRAGLPVGGRGEAGEPNEQGIIVPVLAAAGCWENDPRMFRALRDYWRPLQAGRPAGGAPPRRERHGDDLVDSAMALTVARPPGWTEAWSAAFVSYVVSRAGIVAAGAFVYSSSHAEYVGPAVTAFPADDSYRYVARPVRAFAPRAGDLICSYRSQPRREPWSAEAVGWSLGTAHCDVVVAVERDGDAARVLAVGGNIFQSVSLSVHALTADGLLADSPFRNWAVVLADTANTTVAP